MKLSNTLKLFLIAFLACGVFSCTDKPNQIAKINYDFSGCFGGGKSTLTIFMSETSLMAKLEGYDKTIVKAKLTAMQLDTFKMFFRDLKSLREENGCTTVSHYEVFYQNEVIRKTDGGCDWNGFDKLKDCLFRSPFYLVNTN